MRIALLDSGIGGLSILPLCLEVFPDCTYDYLADILYAPFGTQNRENLLNRLLADIAFLQERKPDLIVLACSSASALLTGLKNELVVGIELDIKTALQKAEREIAIFSTPITAGDPRHIKHILHSDRVCWIADRYLASLLECYAPNFEKVMPYFINLLPTNATAIILGCTHYLFLQDYIKIQAPDVEIFSYSDKLTKRLIKLKAQKLHNTNTEKCINLLFTSKADPEVYLSLAHKIAPSHKLIASFVKIS